MREIKDKAPQWRLSLLRSGEAMLMEFGFPAMAAQKFASSNDLPQWVKERIAVLCLMTDQRYIDGVGAKMLGFDGHAGVYWIDPPNTGIANVLGDDLTDEE